MSTHLAKLFRGDDRAVAPIIGVILLFGIFFIGFAGYQAEYVPQQNAETEFQHYQDVQNDLTVVRNAISRAGQQNQNQFESVQLGTNYPQRILALNPPDPTGTLRTKGPYNIIIDNGTESEEIKTRFIEYQNGYNELNIEPIYYENSVLYLDSEQRVFFEDQNLVQDNGDTVVITALQREFSRSAVGRITVELYPTDSDNPLPAGDEFEITLPTQLPETYWRDQLQGERPISNFGYDGTEDPNQVSFNVSSEDLEFNTVGIDNAPDQNRAVSDMNNGGDNSDNNNDNVPPAMGQVAYAESNNGKLRTLSASGTIRAYDTTQVSTIGPAKASLDGDSNIDIPYVGNNGDLKAIDANNNIIPLDDSWNGQQARIGVGDWNNDGIIEVIYAGNNNKIKTVTASGTLDELPGNARASSIAGVGPFGGSANPAIIFVGSNNNEIKYAEPSSGNSIDITTTSVTVGSSNAIGPPADYDDDSELEVPIEDGNGNIELVDRDGQDGTVDPNIGVAQAPMGKLQVTGDATPEIIFVDSNNKFIQYVNPDNGETGSFELKADNNYGVN